jgi:hypothetical protein
LVNNHNNKSKYGLGVKTKKSLQLLLNDEKFVRDLFSKFESLLKDELLVVDNFAKIKKKKSSEVIQVPIDDMVKKLMKMDFRILGGLNDSLIVTLDILESIALNQIKLKKDIVNLALAFNPKSKQEKENVSKLLDNFKKEEKEFQSAINNVKKINHMSTWWERRFDELKKGKEPYERI